MAKINTFCIPVVLPDFIDRFLDTLSQHTEPDYDVILVDNTREGIWPLVRGRVSCYVRPRANLGFAKSCNIAIRMATTKYVTCANDDIEFIDRRWWSSIMDAFQTYGENVMAVNPSSVKVPGWGYGLPYDFHILPYRKDYSKADYDFLLAGDYSSVAGLPPSFPRHNRWVLDGIATWCTVFDVQRMRIALEEEKHRFQMYNPSDNYFDEMFYPGGGEDYDLNARLYRLGRRLIGLPTTWVYHHWGSSKDHPEKLTLPDTVKPWNKLDELWPREWNGGQSVNVMGHRTLQDGTRVTLKRVPLVTTREF